MIQHFSLKNSSFVIFRSIFICPLVLSNILIFCPVLMNFTFHGVPSVCSRRAEVRFKCLWHIKFSIIKSTVHYHDMIYAALHWRLLGVEVFNAFILEMWKSACSCQPNGEFLLKETESSEKVKVFSSSCAYYECTGHGLLRSMTVWQISLANLYQKDSEKLYFKSVQSTQLDMGNLPERSLKLTNRRSQLTAGFHSSWSKATVIMYHWLVLRTQCQELIAFVGVMRS